MRSRKETGLIPASFFDRDPFEFFSTLPAFRWPVRVFSKFTEGWYPQIDVFERNNWLVTKIDLPGMKKEDVKVEVTDGHLAISGERKHETKEEKDSFYRSEREYGSFYRAVPLPDGIKIDDVKASFADGVLEVTVPLAAKAENTVRKVEIQDAPKAANAAKVA